MTTLRTGLATAALAALALAGACQSTPEEPDPILATSEVVAGSDNQLWKVVLLALNQNGFPQGAEMNRGEMHVVTGWKIELSPWKGKGTRKQAEVTCTPLGPDRWALAVRVRQQVNNTLAQTLDYSYAEWEWVPDDHVLARIVLQHIRSYLHPEIELRDQPDDPIEEYLRKVGEG
jgi:hypothetical protein